jgi:uncharacterized membrane protein
MKKNLTPSEIIILVLIFATFVTGAILYPGMPERIPSHWNAAGEVDGYAPKLPGIFLLPCIMTFVFLLFYAVPRIDPLRANIQQFRTAYDRFILIIVLFLIAIYINILLWSRGIELNVTTVIMLGLAALVFAIGSLCEHAKRNYFVGIRTPWTLQSDSVWNRTHKLGGILFHWISILVALGVFIPRYAIFIGFVPVAGVALFLVIYSYIIYEREQHTIAK